MIKIETIDDVNLLLRAMDGVTFVEFDAVCSRCKILPSAELHYGLWVMWRDNALDFMRSKSPVSWGEALLELVERKMADAETDARRKKNSDEIDECPSEHCKACSGEYCYTHFSKPCDCDVMERHANKPKGDTK